MIELEEIMNREQQKYLLIFICAFKSLRDRVESSLLNYSNDFVLKVYRTFLPLLTDMCADEISSQTD